MKSKVFDVSCVFQCLSSVFYRDMAPEGSTLEESNKNLDEITDLALQLQSQTGIKVLWVTCNLFAHTRRVFLFRKPDRRTLGFSRERDSCSFRL